MINEEIIKEIIEKSNISKEDVVLEIGPGLGTLTKELLKCAKKVIAVEIDEDMVNILKNRFQNDNLIIICEDILKIDLNELTKEFGTIKIVANLPYYITTPIIMKLLESEYDITSITVMVQKEVGERLCSKGAAREMGAITITTQYYADGKIIIDVPKENFLPSPEVDSVVIKLDVLKEPAVKVSNKKIFFGLVKAGFSQRRKTINNSLSSFEYSKDEVNEALKALNINPKLRAEDLTIQDFANLSNYLEDKK